MTMSRKVSISTVVQFVMQHLNNIVILLMRVILNAVHQYSFHRKKQKDKKQITQGLRVGCAKKHFLYQIQFHNPTVANELKFKQYRNTLTRLCRTAEERYFQELIGIKKAYVKMLQEIFGPIVNPSKYKKKSNIEKVLVNGHYVTDANDIANVFNEYFTQVGKSLSDKLPVPKFDFSKYMSDSNPYSIFLSPVTEDELLKEIYKLNNKNLAGIHDIPTNILKSCKHHIKSKLLKLINLSFTSGVFRDCIKVAKLIPLYKKNECYIVGIIDLSVYLVASVK